MNSRKAVFILTKICLSSFQKALVSLILLPNNFLILTRPTWGVCYSISIQRQEKIISNLSRCLFITGPWRTATEQELASPSGDMPATKTSPPRHQFSSTRCWALPCHRAVTHAHSRGFSAGSLHSSHTRHPKTSSAVWADTPEEEGGFQSSLWAQTDRSRCNESPHPSPAACPGDSPAIPLALPSTWRGWNKWLGGWPCWICVTGIHTAGFIEQALNFHLINPLPPENKSYQKVKWQTIDKITSDSSLS